MAYDGRSVGDDVLTGLLSDGSRVFQVWVVCSFLILGFDVVSGWSIGLRWSAKTCEWQR